jgi:hypothetical protein
LALILALLYFPTGIGVIRRRRWATILGTLLGLNPVFWLINGIYFARRWRELGIQANHSAHAIPVSQGSDSMPISQRALGSIILEREQIRAAASDGKALSAEDQKKLAMANFVLGDDGEQSILTTKEMTFEEAKDIRAIGEFTFGDITSLLNAQGHSQGDVFQFLRDIESGALSVSEAILFLTDCKEWESIKQHTDEKRSDFFARKFAEHEAARKKQPSRN